MHVFLSFNLFVYTQLTHLLMSKHEKSGKPFLLTDSRKAKVKGYIEEHMEKYGKVYVRNSAADQEDDADAD